jgi:hypothetical protein
MIAIAVSNTVMFGDYVFFFATPAPTPRIYGLMVQSFEIQWLTISNSGSINIF